MPDLQKARHILYIGRYVQLLAVLGLLLLFSLSLLFLFWPLVLLFSLFLPTIYTPELEIWRR